MIVRLDVGASSDDNRGGSGSSKRSPLVGEAMWGVLSFWGAGVFRSGPGYPSRAPSGDRLLAIAVVDQRPEKRPRGQTITKARPTIRSWLIGPK